MREKLSLADAKKILKSDRVFLNGNSNFNYVDVGKYASGCTFVIPQEWTIDSYGNPENPLRYQEVPELTDNMNMDFDGNAYVLFGIYHVSQTGKPVFKLTSPDKAQDVLVCIGWGGAFCTTRGFRAWGAPKIGEKYYLRAASNGRGKGNDYWVFPVGYVYNSDSRDVSDILLRLSETERKRVKNNEELFIKAEAARFASIEMGKKVMPECKELASRISGLKQKYGKEFSVKFYDAYMSDSYKNIPYTQAYGYLQNILEETIAMISHREEYAETIEQVESDVVSLGGRIDFYDIDRISIRFEDDHYFGKSFVCDSVFHVKELLNYVEKEKARQEKERALIVENTIKAKREQELKEAKIKAKEAGYPETFTYWNRIGGATGQSHAYVISPDGSIRIPDNNILKNRNHRHYEFWLESADGEQVYDQILIGELIIAYTKNCTSAPVKVSVELVPETITEAQKETVSNIYSDLQSRYDNPLFINKSGDVILSGEEWLEKSIY